MKIVETYQLIARGDFVYSDEWKNIQQTVYSAVRSVVWPPGASDFKIFPESGKKRGEGNGVKPIKDPAMDYLKAHGWNHEKPWPAGDRVFNGNIDSVYKSSKGLVGFEWETGNISSSHRALNKLCLGLLKELTIGSFLVVPSRKLYPYLTDRIGNFEELEPYLDLWKSIPCKEGILELIVVEHDATSKDVPRIPKGTDGRHLF
jgi:hypothetical protein